MAIMPEGKSRAPGVDVIATNEQNHRHSELNSMLRQYDLMVDLVSQYTEPNAPRFVLSPEIIVSLQAVLAYPKGPQPGYRLHQVRIATNDFVPMPPWVIPTAIHELCAHINQSWDTSDALELAAYVLWRLNWIHPFGDGNGRTARALSYLILSIKLGGMLPGIPTIPEQLRERRADYFDALAKIDTTFREHKAANVAPLAALLQAMLVKQLEVMPALASEESASVHELVNRRVRTAAEAIVSETYGSTTVGDKIFVVRRPFGPSDRATRSNRRSRGNAY